MKERWKPIPNYSHYQASNLGRIRSVDRTVTVNRKDAAGNTVKGTMSVKGTIIKHWLQHDGRQYVKLVDDNGKRTNGLQVHRLVAFAWHGLPKNITDEVDHKNRNKVDNRSKNLQWMTQEKHKAKSIQEQGNPIILENVKTGKAYQFPSYAEASRKLGISSSSVSALANNLRTVSGGYRLGW